MSQEVVRIRRSIDPCNLGRYSGGGTRPIKSEFVASSFAFSSLAHHTPYSHNSLSILTPGILHALPFLLPDYLSSFEPSVLRTSFLPRPGSQGNFTP